MADVVWDEDSEGNVILCPLTNFAVLDYAGQTVLARLEYKVRAGEPEESLRAAQLVLEPAQAIRLARELSEKADEILSQRSPESAI